ncbi:homocysteine S-methyltransferase [Nakamurella antarctica]|uniref:Homocysteine S-methyltransferase n=1 Tax=Nakamurella antarctica TaxID=1902245 RepID=A0A3G8ZJC7_9ACTN|nr:homocysteine S-methyltransferase [Nakamurella antarctica]AZI57320.1 homocysteine S-methyltransferase [Nakamurella antarctica]
MPHIKTAVADRIARGNVVLDGGLGSLLEHHGHDLTSELWSARFLLEDPESLTRAHAEYFAAGAEIVISGSYQATFEGFAALGLARSEAAAAISESVTLVGDARDGLAADGRERWVAASVGPYGAMLADGSEYRGDYHLGNFSATVTALREWHRPRLEVLRDAGADLLAFETIPNRAEATALLEEIAGTGQPSWLALTCDARTTRAGEPLEAIFELAAQVDEIIAVGFNCTDPRLLADLIPLAGQASGKPVVVYPNSGETWDAIGRSWQGSAAFRPALIEEWVAAGAAVIGGCCRVGPVEIGKIAQQLSTVRRGEIVGS